MTVNPASTAPRGDRARDFYERFVLYQPQPDSLSFTYGDRLDLIWQDSVAGPQKVFNDGQMHTGAGLVPFHCILRP